MDTGLFKWIWRFNAIAIAATVTAALLLIGREMFDEVSDYSDPVVGRAVVNVDETDPSITETFAIGPVDFDRDTGLLRYELMREQTYNYGLRSKETENSTVNIGFLELATGKTRWLLPSNSGLIVREDEVLRIITDANGTERTELRAKLYLVVESDGNNDQRLTRDDPASLMIARPDGRGLVTLLSDLSGYDQSVMKDEGTELILWRTSEGREVASVDVTRFVITERWTLPASAGASSGQ